MDKQKPFLPRCDLPEKWDACMDISIRRVIYSSLAGAFGGLLLFRSPVSRRASVAFGVGVGIGMTYSECYHLFDCSPRIPVPLTNPNGSTLESSRRFEHKKTPDFCATESSRNPTMVEQDLQD